MQRSLFYVLGAITFGILFSAAISSYPLSHSVVVAPAIPAQMSLAGEDVPMDDFGVREALDREFIVNTYRHSGTILYLKKASRWFPVIEPILSEEGVPEDFKYLCVIESGLSQVVSPSGAAGFWQFMKKTAPEYGLEVSTTVDERYNVEKATKAACDYLKESYEMFGSWSLAAASYNMGRTGVTNRLDEQGVSNYWDLHLNSETARYVYRILAVKEVMENRWFFSGFEKVKEERYLLFPKNIPILSTFIKCYLAPLPGIRKLCLSNYMVARPQHQHEPQPQPPRQPPPQTEQQHQHQHDN